MMQAFLGFTAVAIGIFSYLPYFRDVFAGKTKPHAFSWFIWGLLTGIAFFAQLHDNAGPGAWATGITAVVCLAMAALALKVGRQNIAPVDWLFLAGALVALALWAITKNPLGSVVLVTLIDAMAYIPTFRKSFHKPQEETLITYSLAALKFAIAVAALDKFSLVTVLYPLSLVITNTIFVSMVLVRRKSLVIVTRPY